MNAVGNSEGTWSGNKWIGAGPPFASGYSCPHGHGYGDDGLWRGPFRPQHPCNLREISLSNCNTQAHLIFIGASTRSCGTKFDAVCRFLLTSECSHGYGDGSNVAMRYNNSGAKILSFHSPFFWRNSITDSEKKIMLFSSVGSRIPEYLQGLSIVSLGSFRKVSWL